MPNSRRPWWQGAVLYQLYPRSFADSNGDGVEDLGGVRARLDYFEWLRGDGIWLNPTSPSPNRDWGYDVSDYCDVHPERGSLADLNALIGEAGGGAFGSSSISFPHTRAIDMSGSSTPAPPATPRSGSGTSGATRRTTRRACSAAAPGRTTREHASTTIIASCPNNRI